VLLVHRELTLTPFPFCSYIPFDSLCKEVCGEYLKELTRSVPQALHNRGVFLSFTSLNAQQYAFT
jgi:hypothetical protein